MDSRTHDMLRRSAERFPDKEALVFGKERLSYRDFHRRTRSFAGALRERGVVKTDRVGIFLEPSTAQALSVFAVSRAGGAFVPIHHSLFPHQVKHIIDDCRMKGLVLTASKFRELKDTIAHCPSLEFAVVVGGQEESAGPLSLLSFDDLIQHPEECSLPEVAISKDLAAIIYTSGSTGRPKGVMLTHANIVAGASIVSEYVGIGKDDRTLSVLPFSFDAGLNQLMTAFQQGATLVMTNFLLANDIVRKLNSERITGLAGVPTLWSLLAHSRTFQKSVFPHLNYITNTGGPMPQNVLAILRTTLPKTNIFLMYGLTEAFRSTYLPPAEVDRRPHSIGKAIPDTEILVLNEQDEICGPHEVGELVHRGPTVSMGYWGNPEASAQVLRPFPFQADGCCSDERVCYSGDLVKRDEEGFLYFVGRRDNLIKSSGFRVSPSDVEEALCRTGELQDAAVIGVPDDVLGQTIKAFVVPKPNRALNLEQLVALCAQDMPTHMVPKTVEVLSELPKTTSGKVNYQALRVREGLVDA